MILLANYADKTFANAQKYNSYTAKKFGKVDEVIEYGPEKIDSKFIDKNKAWFVVGNSQIGKYGLWRPLILEDAYSKIQEDDYLIYADSGTYFINDIHYLTNFMKERHLNVLVFSIPFVEKDWTKRDVFTQLDADQEDIIYSNQRMSTCFVVRKSKEGTELIEQYKKIAVEHPELFTDQENVMGKENYFGFIQNRHNQWGLMHIAIQRNTEYIQNCMLSMICLDLRLQHLHMKILNIPRFLCNIEEEM